LAFIAKADSRSVVINEIAWMGTENSFSDEWIELYNPGNLEIKLEGWILRAADGKPEIKLTETLPPQGFYLLERTDDQTLPQISADQIYKGALENGGEILELYDHFGNLIDRVDCSQGWFAGKNQEKKTMERKNPNLQGSLAKSWASSQNPGGTPKAQNSVFQIETKTKEKSIESQSQEKPPLPKTQPLDQEISYPSGVIFNEILPSPLGQDAKQEWIEILNLNDFEVDLSGWKISDLYGKTKIYVFPKGTVIGPKGFLVLSRPTTKIVLNNEKDELLLFWPNDQIVDRVSFNQAKKGQSLSLTDQGWQWSKILTPGSANLIFQQQSKPSLVKKEKMVAQARSWPKIEKIQSEFSLILAIALILALFSGAIIFLLKRKLRLK